MKRASGKSNLSIVKDYLNGERPFIQVGYSPEIEVSIKKEGEIWTDSQGRKWIKKNGYKKAINSVNSETIDAIKQTCKDCGMEIKWGNRYDVKFFNKTGRCYDCIIKFETKLRREGKFEDYEKQKVLNNQLSMAKDFKSKLEESLDFLETHDKVCFPNSDGSLDEWTIEKKKSILKDLKTDLNKINKTIDTIEKSLKEVQYVE